MSTYGEKKESGPYSRSPKSTQENFTKLPLSLQEKLLQHAQWHTAAVYASDPTPVNQLIAAILAAQASAPLPQSWIRIYAVLDAIVRHEIQHGRHQ